MGHYRKVSVEISAESLAAYLLYLGLSGEEASTLQSQYFVQYGLTLRGLQRHHDVGNTKFSSLFQNENVFDPMSCRPDGL